MNLPSLEGGTLLTPPACHATGLFFGDQRIRKKDTLALIYQTSLEDFRQIEPPEALEHPPMKPMSAIVFAAAIALAPATALAGDLRVRLTGIEKEIGFVRVALFANASDFDAGTQMAGIFTIARKSGLEVVFANLPPGRYGLSSFHDVNGNEDLDANLIGIPKEPFGFSRNARGRLGPPAFEDLSIEMGTEDVTLEIELQ